MLPICRKALYDPTLPDLPENVYPGLTIHPGLISMSIQHSKVDKFRKKE